jgi:ATP-binding cassette subfamily F protein 3
VAGQKARQARSKRKALEKIDRIEIPPDPWVKAEELKLGFGVGERTGGKEVLKAENLTLAYDSGPCLVKSFDLTVFRGERIGIVGPNGCGKTTLLQALIGRQPPTDGRVKLGHDIRVGYFDQKRDDLDPDHTLVDEIRAARGEVSTDVARNILGSLRFSGDEVYRPVRTLSGGEQNRLSLGKLSLRPYNLLALDEPTNHLDIPARQALEASLMRYDGTLLVVSHDRYFLDRLVDKIVFFTHPGKVELFWGGYTEARGQIRGRPGQTPDAATASFTGRSGSVAFSGDTSGSTGPSPQEGTVEDARKAKALRMAERKAKKEQKRAVERLKRRFTEAETRIESLEARLRELDAEIGAANDEWPKLNALTLDRGQVESELDQALDEWYALGDELQKARRELEREN